MSFIGRLFEETFENGKMLIAYAAMQFDGITSFPGLLTAVKTAAADGTRASYIDLGVQILMAVAATHRAGKIVVNAATK